MSNKVDPNLDKYYFDAIQDAFQIVHEEHQAEADEHLKAQIEALRTCLEDCRSYQQELQADAAIAHYGDDLPDDIMPKELIDAAA